VEAEAMTLRSTLILGLLALSLAAPALAESEGVAVAKKLAVATVTVRASEPGKADDVTVFSGVSLGGGLVVTFSSAPETWRYRLTLPDGSQADGELRVRDLYSGLIVLEIPQKDLPGLALADELPDAGSTLYTAAAAGIDKPVLSRGILGAVDRKFSPRDESTPELPPLLQCDVRTTLTSPGAAMADSEGRLVGVIAVHSLKGEGWTYAVPVRDVKRVHEAYTKGEVKTLRPQRPVLGLKLAGKGEESVEVEAVTPGGPAEKAGIRKGDQVLAVEGQKVRSVYHVVGEVIKRQPGERMNFTVQQGSAVRTVGLTLARGEPLEQRPGGLRGRFNDKGEYEIVPYAADTAPPPARVPRDPVGLLEAQINRVYKLLELQQQANERLSREMEKVQQENAALKRELSDLKRDK
jgi:putative serine protease PepD